MLKNKDGLSRQLKEICSFLDGLNKSMEINSSETGLTKRVKTLQHRTAGGDFGTEYPNDDGSIYKHEGVDYSGQYFNVMKDWYKGLWGETIYGE
ncbi:MAG: hypothetical protein ACI4LX_09800 [Treponema sp.]